VKGNASPWSSCQHTSTTGHVTQEHISITTRTFKRSKSICAGLIAGAWGCTLINVYTKIKIQQIWKLMGVWYCIFTAEVKQNFVKIFRVCSLVPRPHPDFISQPWRKTDFSPRLRDKIWVGPGDEATEFVLDHLGPQLKLKVYQDMFVDQICSEQSQRDRSTAALHQWKHNCQHNHCYQDRAYQLK